MKQQGNTLKQIIPERGASVLELVIVMAIFTTLFGMITINLFNAKDKVSLRSTLTTLLADIRQQQARAMTMDTDNTNIAKEYGVYFSQNSYTLFTGSAYNATDSANFVVPLGDFLLFSPIALPNQSLIFTRQNGELANFTSGQSAITLKNSQNNEAKTIQINKLGVPDQVN